MEKNYKILNAHSHIFPEKVSEKATKAIGEFYDIPMDLVGNSKDLIVDGNKVGILKHIICSSATTPRQVKAINDFITYEAEHNKEFIPLGTLHPYMEDFIEEVERIVQKGVKGLKIHPDFQKFPADEDKAIEMYKVASKYNLPILFHAGDKTSDLSSPHRIRKICDKVPDLRIIAAHFGGHQSWDEVIPTLKHSNIYFDTSSSLPFITKEMALNFINYFGAERFMFGTDFPMWNAEDELQRFFNLELSEEENKIILYDNALKIYNLDESTF